MAYILRDDYVCISNERTVAGTRYVHSSPLSTHVEHLPPGDPSPIAPDPFSSSTKVNGTYIGLKLEFNHISVEATVGVCTHSSSGDMYRTHAVPCAFWTCAARNRRRIHPRWKTWQSGEGGAVKPLEITTEERMKEKAKVRRTVKGFVCRCQCCVISLPCMP
jgi:hypothetical protein